MRNKILITVFFILLAGFLAHLLFSSFLTINYEKGTEKLNSDGMNAEIAVLKDVIPPPVHINTPNSVKAIYMTSWVAGTSEWKDELVKLVSETELNGIVIDVKDYTGQVSFDTDNEVIIKAGSIHKRISNMREIIDDMHEKDIYVIARITVFQDPLYSAKFTKGAIKDKRGGLWKDKNGLTYMDPSYEPFWDYIIEVARASEFAGFDELNFDYIRFPSDGNISQIEYPFYNGQISKAESLEEFFKYLSSELNDVGVPVSADLFGFTTENTDDLNIGQVLERAEPYFDFISPMVYPSHYPKGYAELANPAAHPYEVVKRSMDSGVSRLIAASSTPSKLRPWLQDFDLGATYDAGMVRKQIRAVYDAGLESWMMWDPANKYTKDAYLKN